MLSQRSFTKEVQDDKGPVILFVILNEVKNLIPQLLRSFAKEAQDDRMIEAQDGKQQSNPTPLHFRAQLL